MGCQKVVLGVTLVATLAVSASSVSLSGAAVAQWYDVQAPSRTAPILQSWYQPLFTIITAPFLPCKLGQKRDAWGRCRVIYH